MDDVLPIEIKSEKLKELPKDIILCLSGGGIRGAQTIHLTQPFSALAILDGGVQFSIGAILRQFRYCYCLRFRLSSRATSTSGGWPSWVRQPNEVKTRTVRFLVQDLNFRKRRVNCRVRGVKVKI